MNTSRRWWPGARSRKVRREVPNRVRRRSSTYLNRSAPPLEGLLTATCTVSVEPACAPAFGERIDRRGAGVLTFDAALLARVLAGAGVVAEVVVLLVPQPLVASASATPAHSGPLVRSALMVRFLSVSGRGRCVISMLR